MSGELNPTQPNAKRSYREHFNRAMAYGSSVIALAGVTAEAASAQPTHEQNRAGITNVYNKDSAETELQTKVCKISTKRYRELSPGQSTFDIDKQVAQEVIDATQWQLPGVMAVHAPKKGSFSMDNAPGSSYATQFWPSPRDTHEVMTVQPYMVQCQVDSKRSWWAISVNIKTGKPVFTNVTEGMKKGAVDLLIFKDAPNRLQPVESSRMPFYETPLDHRVKYDKYSLKGVDSENKPHDLRIARSVPPPPSR